MENGGSCFPLLDLASDSLECVLRNMDLFYLVGFSILSKRSKKLVESLNLEVQEILVSIGDIVFIKICSLNSVFLTWCFYKEEHRRIRARENLPLKEMYTPSFVRTFNIEDGETNIYEWKNPGFEIPDWIDHFRSIFHNPKMQKLCFTGRTPFNLDSLKKSMNDVTEILIEDGYPVRSIQNILQTYPKTKQLALWFNIPKHFEEYHHLLCQNFDVLTLVSWAARLKIDDLLLINSREIKLYHPNLTEKDFNIYLKHWSNGVNTRLESFEIRSPLAEKPPNIDILFRGLNYQIIPSHHERMFKRSVKDFDGFRTETVKDGYDIQRRDGTTATIVFCKTYRHQFYAMKMYVWH